MILALLPETAEAAGFQAKTMRAPLSSIDVERPLILGKGWLQFGFGYDYKFAYGQWSPEGEVVVWDYARWLYTTERIDIRYGISQRADFYWNIPFHWVALVNNELGTDTRAFGIGDPHFGWRLEWFGRNAPIQSLVSEVDLKFPAGSESPGSYVGGPNTVTTFPLSSGQSDLSLGARYKHQFGPFAITAGAAYIYRFSAVTQYVLETNEYQFLGRFKPGAEVRIEVSPMVQIWHIALGADIITRARTVAKMGTTSGGIFPDRNLDPVPESDGWSVDLAPKLALNLTRGVDLRLGMNIPVRGEDLAFFPMEEFSPTLGPTTSGTLEFRY